MWLCQVSTCLAHVSLTFNLFAQQVGDANVDVRLSSDVDRLTVQDPDADEEEAVEAVVSPQRPSVEQAADGSFSDESERSMSQTSDQSVSEGDISVESDISDSHAHEEPEHDQESKDVPLGSRIRHSLSTLGNLLPNLLKSSAENATLPDEVEEEVDIVDQGVPTVKAEPVDEDDDHEELHFPSDSEDEDEDKHTFSGPESHNDVVDEEAEYERANAIISSHVEASVKVEDTPIQTRRLVWSLILRAQTCTDTPCYVERFHDSPGCSAKPVSLPCWSQVYCYWSGERCRWGRQLAAKSCTCLRPRCQQRRGRPRRSRGGRN
jgi:hypothetical protein